MKLGYTVIYVADVEATVSFYERAFGVAPLRRLEAPQVLAAPKNEKERLLAAPFALSAQLTAGA